MPSLLGQRRRVGRALWAVVIEVYVSGFSTRKVDEMVAAALRSVFVQIQAWAVKQVIAILTEKFPAAVAWMEQAKEDVLAFRSFPSEQWCKIWSTNPLERLNKEIKRRTRVVAPYGNVFGMERRQLS